MLTAKNLKKPTLTYLTAILFTAFTTQFSWAQEQENSGNKEDPIVTEAMERFKKSSRLEETIDILEKELTILKLEKQKKDILDAGKPKTTSNSTAIKELTRGEPNEPIQILTISGSFGLFRAEVLFAGGHTLEIDKSTILPDNWVIIDMTASEILFRKKNKEILLKF